MRTGEFSYTGPEARLAIIVLVDFKNVGQHQISVCSGVKPISNSTVCKSIYQCDTLPCVTHRPHFSPPRLWTARNMGADACHASFCVFSRDPELNSARSLLSMCSVDVSTKIYECGDRMVKREKELHLQILAFSISHDHRTVRIYGHYPVIDGNKTKFYRHPIREFSFTELDGKEKWTSYKFTKNVYDIWMPTHLKRICSVIDALPDFEVSQQSELGESGLSQVLESHNLSELSNRHGSSLREDADSQSSRVGDATPETSVSQRIEEGAFKKPKKRGRPVKLH
jgi:hypothetical protein